MAKKKKTQRKVVINRPSVALPVVRRIGGVSAKTPGEDGLFDDERGILTASGYQLPKGYLSPSAINTYLRCPQQFKRRYVDGVVTPPGVAMVEGTCHHDTIEANSRQKMKGRRDWSAKQMFERFADTFTVKKKEIEDWEDETPDTILRRGEGLTREFAQSFAPRLQPEEVETDVEFYVGPVKIYGRLDFEGSCDVEGAITPVLADFKTVKKRMSDSDLLSSLQLTAYSMWKQQTDTRKFKTGFVSLVKTQKPQVVDQWTDVDFGRIRWFRHIVLSVANAISLGSFPLVDPTSWACSPRFCGYFRDCRGRYE